MTAPFRQEKRGLLVCCCLVSGALCPAPGLAAHSLGQSSSSLQAPSPLAQFLLFPSVQLIPKKTSVLFFGVPNVKRS